MILAGDDDVLTAAALVSTIKLQMNSQHVAQHSVSCEPIANSINDGQPAISPPTINTSHTCCIGIKSIPKHFVCDFRC
jgi:hypothetical protein